ncbi:limbic system-associated membrane protein-like [Gigantopelta aegis]|uniref:limbic system-associated membrane protein-like n=1 Tax=Gigantopelta aegis TaxID=1735272 RepID=UPI001B88D816|nr:limbic system-associated membrane protein-like [Gigantopelta aegis]
MSEFKFGMSVTEPTFEYGHVKKSSHTRKTRSEGVWRDPPTREMCLRASITLWLLLEVHLISHWISVATEFRFGQNDRVIDETPINVKVVAKTTAILPCTVDPKYTEGFNDEYKVVWVNPEHIVISLQDRRMLNDMRITVERPFLSDWNLHIRNISLKDAGIYSCQINTVPPRFKKVNLIVQVPPKITYYTRPTDIKVRVGDDVQLMCNSTGIPPPTITWYRLNRYSNKAKEKIGFEGEVLRIRNISRVCADSYECVANNSVPPSKSRQIKVTVEYPPEIRLPNSRIGQIVGRETILECIISSSPLGVTVWKRHGVELSTSWKYEVDLYNDGPHTVTLTLRIANIDHNDFGIYMCEALNPHGMTSAKMMLYEVFPFTRPPPTTTTTTQSYVHYTPKVMIVSNAGGNQKHGSGSFGHYSGGKVNMKTKLTHDKTLLTKPSAGAQLTGSVLFSLNYSVTVTVTFIPLHMYRTYT